MRVWRLCSRRFALPDGEGARLYGGRWNVPGTAIVYAAATLSLAALELLVHTDSDLLPERLVAVAAEIPESLKIEEISQDDLPDNWVEYPPPEAVQALGSQWTQRRDTAVLSVPSVIIPGEQNYLLNPKHPEFARIRWCDPTPFTWDPRLYNNSPLTAENRSDLY